MKLNPSPAVCEKNTAKDGGQTGAAAAGASNPAIAKETRAKDSLDNKITSAAPPLTPLEEVIPEAILRAEIATWAKRMGVVPKEVHLRPMKRKWASCSRNGRLTFDTALLSQPAAFRAEVVVHELLHLKVRNHGPVFRSLLRVYLEKYRVS
jgi:predicted metal-dependent hydrolase